MRNRLRQFFPRILFFLFIIVGYFFIGGSHEAADIKWGVNFSQSHAQDMGLSWKDAYLDILNELKVRRLKIAVPWDLIEPEKDGYFFDDLDWQIKEAENCQAKIILVVGMKTPRWPECHIPAWAESLSKEEQQKEILEMIEEVVLRYKRSPVLQYWQVENEPFFPFGECPWRDTNFLIKEIALVRLLDSHHQVIISDTGEFSLWIKAARYGDVVGTTLYRQAWFEALGMRIDYPFPSVYYWRRTQIVRKLFKKSVICVELQGEPWGPFLLYNLPFDFQKRLMDLERFQKNIEFAKKTGIDEFYLWGGEWWYWLKQVHGDDKIWNEARSLFNP